MAALSLTEEMFAAIQGLSYSESIKFISPGSGLPEGMLNSLEHAEYYELDTRLTYKGYQRKKGAKRKTMVNPTMMYTMFSVFAEDSPQQVRWNMVQWIHEHKSEFERQTLLAFSAKDSQLDTWLSSIDSNSMPGDEFALFALCQMYTCHALIITQRMIWTTIHVKHGLTDHELRRKCDLHLIYLGGDAFGILKPKFEWKYDVPVGHIAMVSPPEKPLQDTTDEVLSKEANADNSMEVKDEPQENLSQTQTELPDVTPPVENPKLRDATQNLIVELPPEMQLNLEDVPQIPNNMEAQTKPCSIKLHRCDIEPSKPLPRVPLEVNVVVQECAYDLRKREQTPKNPATSTSRAKRSVSLNVSYTSLFDDSSSEDTSNSVQTNQTAPSKKEPSHYRLAAHKYMLARKIGLNPGPTVRTRASTIEKRDKNNNSSSDSDATVVMDETHTPQTPVKKPIKGRKPKKGRKIKTKTFVTRTYSLRRGGIKPKRRTKHRKPYLFKCLMCDLKWPTCKERNDHFKRKHRKLQCKQCKKFFRTPSAYSLHQYIHKDGQFECKTCQACFPFRSQLDYHIVSHSDTREYKCKEPFCDRDFTHKSDLVKHERTHSGVVYQCSRCDYSNPDERNYQQHLRKHTAETPFQCKKCGQRFKYTMQLKRHRLSPDNSCT